MKQNDMSFIKKETIFSPFFLLKLEAMLWFCVGLFLFHYVHGSWWTFFFLFLIPDLSLIAKIFDMTRAKQLYNLTHTEIVPALLVVLSMACSMPIVLHLGVIWFCHINFDRMLGLGLKYLDKSNCTHLGISLFKSISNT